MPGAVCRGLRSQYDGYMAQTPPDLYHAAQTWDQMNSLHCDDMPADPDPENTSGGHGSTIPPGG